VKGKRFDLIEGENSIGRDTGAHVCVNNPKVSTRHARIIWTGETFSLEDLGSTNGTFLNELPIKAEEPQILENSDEIRLGKEVRLKFIKVTAEP
jgi:pSer/pThr/pTyr-binding forkhead associated (FHA) protein